MMAVGDGYLLMGRPRESAALCRLDSICGAESPLLAGFGQGSTHIVRP
ncbi:hypothetical protein EE612_060612 [Oryza sativa]|nr:hypothetical protein EE612_060612 [Oryza sativa]